MAALATVAIGAAPSLAVPASAAAQPQSAGSLVVTQIAPRIPKPDDTLQISGYVRITGENDIGPLTVRLEAAFSPFRFRSAFDGYASGAEDEATFVVSGAAAQLDLGTASGELDPFRILVPVADLQLDERGPYALKVIAEGAGVSAEVRTFLPWYPDPDQVKPTNVVLLWPLVDRPVVDQDGVFANDRLASLLSPRGRLGALLDAAAGQPVSWIVDPDLVVSADAMVNRYRVRSRGDVVDGDGAKTAQTWLRDLDSGTSAGEVLRLPYADADMAALAQGRHTDDIEAAARTADGTLQHTLPRSTAVVWPAAGLADRATLGAVRAAGYDLAVLSENALPTAQPLSFTPDGVASIGTDRGEVRGLLADPGLSEIFAQDTREPGASALLVQRFLAETAMITEELPNRSRTILVAPPKRWNPDPELARQLIAAYTSAPWIAPATATDLARTEPGVDRATLAYSPEAQRHELPQRHIKAVESLRANVTDFSAVLRDPRDLVSSFRNALLRAESSAWADGEGNLTNAGRTYLHGLEEGLDNQEKKVRILSRGTVTLSSNSGTIPVTVANDLDQPVTVRLSLRPTNSRLKIDSPPPFEIDPKSRETVEVKASAVANGIVTVNAVLTNASGDRIGPVSQFKVRSTNFGRVGFAIIGGAIALLVASITIRLVRRRRRPGSGPPGSAPAEQPQPDPAQVRA